MDDFFKVERLVEMLSAFFTEGEAVEEDLPHSLTSEFLRNIQDVLFTKQIVCYSKFQEYFNNKSEEMLSAMEIYLKCVYRACVQEGLLNQKIFEKFLNAFAIILRVSIETRLRKGVDFCELVPDIFMAFYDEEISVPFRKCKGFFRFVEYINDPKYLQSKCIVRNISSFYDPIVFVNEIPKDLREKAQRMMQKEPKLEACFNFSTFNIDDCTSKMVEIVLKDTNPEFFPVPYYYGLNASPSNSVQQKMAQIDERKKNLAISEAEFKVISERCPNSSPASKTNNESVVQLTDNEQRYENIIEAVIRHNHSKSSCHAKLKSRIQTEADQNLEHLKSKIKSLSQVLEEYDKE